MRRFYIVPRVVWEEPIMIGGHVMPRFNLFHPGEGSHCIHLDDKHMLIATDFTSSWAEETWHAHPEVARLPHPIYEAQCKVSELHANPAMGHKQFKSHHYEKLKKIGLQDHHTVWDLHKIAIAILPSCKLSSLY